MADMRKKRSEIGRMSAEFKKWAEEMSRLKSYQENQKISPARITLAVYNLRNKYPIDDEIRLSKLGKHKQK
jgi:hypothetical protein